MIGRARGGAWVSDRRLARPGRAVWDRQFFFVPAQHDDPPADPTPVPRRPETASGSVDLAASAGRRDVKR